MAGSEPRTVKLPASFDVERSARSRDVDGLRIKEEAGVLALPAKGKSA